MAEAAPDLRQERTFCRFCIALCGLRVTVQGERVVRVEGDRDDPLSAGYSCEKGRALAAWHHAPHRLDHPLVRLDGTLRRATWTAALDDLSERLQRIVSESGPSAVGAYLATGAVFDAAGHRFASRWLDATGSTSHYSAGSIDSPAKALVSELLTGRHWLVPTMDYERGTLFLFIGTNPVISHGHFNGLTNPVALLRRLRERGEVWVIDPRATETARLATRHLAPTPGSDFAILAFLVRELLHEGADHEYLAAHASGVRELKAAVEPWDSRRAAARTGLTEDDLRAILAAVRRHRRVAGQTGTGVTMSVEANVAEWLLWCLHAVTGSFERRGGVWFNPGYLRQLDRRDWSKPFQAPEPAPMPSRPDLPRRFLENPTAALADEALAGNLRALVVAGGNPLSSAPGAEQTRRGLAQLEVLAVADVRETPTTELATHVLPLAGQLERADVSHFIDQFLPVTAARYTPAVVAPAAERRPMWWLFAALAERMDHPLLSRGLDTDGATDDDLLTPVAERGRGGSFASLRDARLELAEPSFGWVEGHLLPEGRYQLWHGELGDQLRSLEARPAAELVLIPRRQRRHLNSQLTELQPERGSRDQPELLINPADAASRGLADGALVSIRTPTGSLIATLRLSPEIVAGVVSLPHGWSKTNVEEILTTAGADPLTGMPRMSGMAVELAAGQPKRVD